MIQKIDFLWTNNDSNLTRSMNKWITKCYSKSEALIKELLLN